MNSMLQLWLSSATLISPGVYHWILKIDQNLKHAKTIKLDQVSLPFSWPLWDALTLLFNQGGPLSVVLDGNWDANNLGGHLQTLFPNCTACTLDLSTNKISFMFSVGTTLNISKWNIRARQFLGAGDQDITDTAGVINFPFKYNLGGDNQIKMELPLSQTIMVGSKGDNVLDKIPVPVTVNPTEFFDYQPEGYYLATSGCELDAELDVAFTDKWDQPIDFKGSDGFIQLRLQY